MGYPSRCSFRQRPRTAQQPLAGGAAGVHTAKSQSGLPGVVVRLRHQCHLLAALEPGPDERGHALVAEGVGGVHQGHVGLRLLPRPRQADHLFTTDLGGHGHLAC